MVGWQVIAGEEDFDVTVKEGGYSFTFNFRDVYWNSRCALYSDSFDDSLLAEVDNSHQTFYGAPAPRGPYCSPLHLLYQLWP